MPGQWCPGTSWLVQTHDTVRARHMQCPLRSEQVSSSLVSRLPPRQVQCAWTVVSRDQLVGPNSRYNPRRKTQKKTPIRWECSHPHHARVHCPASGRTWPATQNTCVNCVQGFTSSSWKHAQLEETVGRLQHRLWRLLVTAFDPSQKNMYVLNILFFIENNVASIFTIQRI